MAARRHRAARSPSPGPPFVRALSCTAGTRAALCGGGAEAEDGSALLWDTAGPRLSVRSEKRPQQPRADPSPSARPHLHQIFPFGRSRAPSCVPSCSPLRFSPRGATPPARLRGVMRGGPPPEGTKERPRPAAARLTPSGLHLRGDRARPTARPPQRGGPVGLLTAPRARPNVSNGSNGRARGAARVGATPSARPTAQGSAGVTPGAPLPFALLGARGRAPHLPRAAEADRGELFAAAMAGAGRPRPRERGPQGGSGRADPSLTFFWPRSPFRPFLSPPRPPPPRRPGPLPPPASPPGRLLSPAESQRVKQRAGGGSAATAPSIPPIRVRHSGAFHPPRVPGEPRVGLL